MSSLDSQPNTRLKSPRTNGLQMMESCFIPKGSCFMAAGPPFPPGAVVVRDGAGPGCRAASRRCWRKARTRFVLRFRLK